MYKAELAKRVGGYQMEPVEDYDYWLRLTDTCEISYIPVELVNYRVNSTYSVSVQLQTTEKHRNWRYAFHLTRLQARCRRNVQPLLAVLYPVVKSGPEELSRLENLYEQTFSNYYCQVLNLSPSQEPSIQLSSISHPVTEFLWIPSTVENHALYRAIENIKTPFTLILGPKPFISIADIDELLASLNPTDGDTLSNYYTDDHSMIEYRYRNAPSPKNNLYNELFRTADLKSILGII